MSYSRLAVLVALVVGGVGFVLWLVVKPQMPRRGERTGSAPAQVEVRRPFMLPVKTVDATRVLGARREAVRALLGPPVEELAAVDRFTSPVALRVRYEGDVAIALQLTAPKAGDNVDLVRKWLKLPQVEPMLVAGAQYEIGAVEDEADVVVVERVARAVAPQATPRATPRAGAAEPVAKHPSAGTGVVLAAEVVRGFPLLPPDLPARCEKKPVPGETVLLCSRGVDANLAYEKAGAAASLTVLGPPGASSLASCRGWLQRVVSGASAAGVAREDDETTEFFRKGDVRYAVRWLSVDFAGGPRCTVSACSGGASACR